MPKYNPRVDINMAVTASFPTTQRNLYLFGNLELFIDTEPHSATVNMANDEILFLKSHAPLLRIYSWLKPAVSFGYFEKSEPIKNQYPDREPVRRWTGGGGVLHGDDLTFSLLVPRTCSLARITPAESYLAIHAHIVRALHQCGMQASIAGCCDKKTSSGCFENAVRHDILFNERKIVGGAQRRTRSGLLHQGSIQHILLPSTFVMKLAESCSTSVAERKMNSAELREATVLAEAKYADSAWMQKF